MQSNLLQWLYRGLIGIKGKKKNDTELTVFIWFKVIVSRILIFIDLNLDLMLDRCQFIQDKLKVGSSRRFDFQSSSGEFEEEN